MMRERRPVATDGSARGTLCATALVIVAALFACGGGAEETTGVYQPPPPPLPPPAPLASADSVILFDQGHFNYHRLSTTYAAFAREATNSGWFIEAVPEISNTWLSRGRVLVIAGALAATNYPNSWRLPTPSAFSAAEIDVIRNWVGAGGGLLLIADHMPFPGGAGDLASAFGARFSNGFAFDRAQLTLPNPCLRSSEVHVFSRAAGTLADHAVTAGVQRVATFTGAAFESSGTPVLTFTTTSVSLEPSTAWVFGGVAERSVAGWLQGVLTSRDKGRVAIFGEAAMFSEQMCDATTPMGMNHPLAADNARLLRNLLRWLGGR
jgi:hypothetical protein